MKDYPRTVVNILVSIPDGIVVGKTCIINQIDLRMMPTMLYYMSDGDDLPIYSFNISCVRSAQIQVTEDLTVLLNKTHILPTKHNRIQNITQKGRS